MVEKTEMKDFLFVRIVKLVEFKPVMLVRVKFLFFSFFFFDYYQKSKLRIWNKPNNKMQWQRGLISLDVESISCTLKMLDMKII